MARVRDLLDTIGNVILAGYDWRAVWRPGRPAPTSTRWPEQSTTCVIRRLPVTSPRRTS